MNIDTPIDRALEFKEPIKSESCTALWRAVFHRAYNDATTPIPKYSAITHMHIREIMAARALFLQNGFYEDLETICDMADITLPLRRDVHEAIALTAATDIIVNGVNVLKRRLIVSTE